MLLEKTELAREALRTRSPLLSVRERQLLVLVDGRRTVAELRALMGEAVERELDALHSRAFVQGVAQERAVHPAAAKPGGAGAFRGPVVAPGASAGPTPSTTPSMARTPRRSLAGSRLYLTDMLLMMRQPSASAWAAALQSNDDVAQLLDTMAGACQYLLGLQERAMGPAVVRQLLATLPEENAQDLEELLGEDLAAACAPSAALAVA